MVSYFLDLVAEDIVYHKKTHRNLSVGRQYKFEIFGSSLWFSFKLCQIVASSCLVRIKCSTKKMSLFHFRGIELEHIEGERILVGDSPKTY